MAIEFTKIYITTTGKASEIEFLDFVNPVKLSGFYDSQILVTTHNVTELIELTKYDTAANIVTKNSFKNALTNELIRAYNEFAIELKPFVDGAFIAYDSDTGKETSVNPDTVPIIDPETGIIPDLDLSGYQLTSAKGQANGYAELDGTGKVPEAQLPATSGGGTSPQSMFGEIEYYEPLWANTLINSTDWSYFDSNNTPSGGVTVISSSLVKLENGLSITLRFPLSLAGANGVAFIKPYAFSGNVNAEWGAILINSGVPYTLTIENVVTTSLTTVATTDASLISGVGNFYSLSQSLASYAGSGLFIKRNATVNGGNYTYGKILNGSVTEVNSSQAFIGEQITKTTFEYNRQTEIAKFYVNDVEIGTLSSVNLANTTQFIPELGLANNSGSAVIYSWVSRRVKIKRNA